MSKYFLAVDIGASSGRHILGSYENGKIELEEVHRFFNGMDNVDGTLCWDTERLWNEILTGMKKCKEMGKIPATVGVDTWGVDFVLLDKDENIREFVDSNVATIPYKVFSPDKTYRFIEMPDVANLNNKQILKRLINLIIKDGYDILVRDVSTLEFPSFRIIIPGMTEMTHSKMAGRFFDFEELEKLLKDLKQIFITNKKVYLEIDNNPLKV